MARIMRLPRGLLSLFEAKSDGANPPDYDENLRLTANVYEHYLPAAEFIVDSTGSPTAVAADIGDVQVPNGEQWIIRAVGYRIGGVAATGTVTASNILLPAGSAVSMNFDNQVQNSFVGTTSIHRQAQWFTPTIMLESGSIIRFRVDATTTNVNCSNLVLFHRLRV